MKELITILEVSVERNGKDTILTLGHLLNICKKAEHRKRMREEQEDTLHKTLVNDIGGYV
jgi:hypothetical protein